MPHTQHNPFEFKEPLTDGAGRGILVERTRQMQQALQLLQRGGFLTVCAPPRSGVTTFLYSLRKLFHQAIYLDLANFAFAEDPPRQVAAKLAAEVGPLTGVAVPQNPASVTDVLSAFVKSQAGGAGPQSSRTLTVIVDGFDSWDDSAACKLVLALRAAYTEARTADAANCWFSVITGSAVDLRDLTSSGRTSPLNIAQHVFLPDLEEPEIRELLMNGLSNLRSTGSFADTDKIAEGSRNVAYWTGGHPALAQMLGHMAFQRQSTLGHSDIWGELLPVAREEARQLLASPLNLLNEREDLRRSVCEIYEGADIPCDRIHRPIRDLIHLGLIRADQTGIARPRNLLFEEVMTGALKLPARDLSQRIRQTSIFQNKPGTANPGSGSSDAVAPEIPGYSSAFEWPASRPSTDALEKDKSTGAMAAKDEPESTPSAALPKQNPPDETPLVQPGTVLGGCKIIRKIGRGGMAEVYLARHLALDADVAIKVMRNNSQDPRTAQRFLREARAAAQLSHENIVQIRNVGRENGVEFIEMEYLAGGSLSELMKRGPYKDYPHAVKLLREAAAGVQAAHAKGIIHRDLKPDNLMIAHDGRVKVVDFGLAAIRSGDGARLTEHGVVVGTPHFMAPEQWEGKAADERSDIYSLGATFYDLLAGRTPYDGKTAMEVIGNFFAQTIAHPHKFNPGIPVPLGKAIMKMLQKKAADRYASIRELLSDPDGLGNKSL